MSNPNLILIGAGGHAHACIDVIEHQGQYQIAGLIGMPAEMYTRHFGYSVLGTDDDLLELVKAHPYALVTVGQIQSPDNRIRLYQRATILGFRMPVIIAPGAYVSRHATIGAGTVVMQGAIVNAGVNVGCNCIINTRAVLEHDSRVEDDCHVSTGVILNGNVYIGKGSFVGSGSIVKEGVTIGKRCIVGMCLSVRHNLIDGTRFVGERIS